MLSFTKRSLTCSFAACLLAILPVSSDALVAELYGQDFEIDGGGLFASGASSSWQLGVPTNGPLGAQSGSQCWATSLAGGYSDNEDSYLTSASIDLSAHSGGPFIFSWWQYLETEVQYDAGSLEVSNDGGVSWQRVYGEASGPEALTWKQEFVLLDESMAVSSFRYRFRMRSDLSESAPGYYIDSIRIFALELQQVYFEDFETDEGGYVDEGTLSTWEYGPPVAGPGAAWSGQNAWGTNLDAFYVPNEDSGLVSSEIDLSAHDGKEFIVSWRQHLKTESIADVAMVEVRASSASPWVKIYGEVSGVVSEDWTRKSVMLGPEIATETFQIRFALQADGSFENTGFYIDDVEVHAIGDGIGSISYETSMSFPSGTAAADRLPEADYDRDGRSNFLEYGFLTDATGSNDDLAPKIVVIEAGGKSYAGIEFSVRSNDPALVYAFETSEKLSSWSSFALNFTDSAWTVGAGGPVLHSNMESASGIWRIQVRADTPLDAGGSLFMRVSVVR